MKQRLQALLAGASLLLAACATSPAPQYTGLDQAAAGTSQSHELTEVPFHPQDAYQCGPAALATIMNTAGVDIDADALKPEVYLPDRRGSLQPELLAAARRQGLVAYAHAPSFANLLREVDGGNPVLVLQNLGLTAIPIWHYAVVVGFDWDAATVILRSGTTERQVLSFERFERSWRDGGYWAMTVHAPGDMPATVDEGRYLRAVTAMEDTAPEAARAAYQAAASAWPENGIPHLGMGNLAYRQSAFSVAKQHYRQAVRYAPESPAVHHNLAWALLRLERYEEALAHAREAAALAETGQSQYFGALEAVLRR
ncbi:PA2778 family cysteine peptidase [Aquisalimonas sp.]|uniref:PA2778 family cysteine peptidase n=1 Tax=Aquisalimonas sp. TaxID=1872621 RepID=UPI0025C6C3E9|nr:PA2778 family cysteine peptidase [Aquisalimonas sp.]